MGEKEKVPYQWFYEGSCVPPVGFKPAKNQKTFSVGIIQWIPAKNGLKRSAAIKRVKGDIQNPSPTLHKAQKICDDLNDRRVNYPVEG
jgi:hypothetical protein